MHLEKLSLTYFKSYEVENFVFSPHINCILGDNGSGKTNLLDAIYFLCLTKSAFSNQDALSIRHLAEYMVIDGVFEHQQHSEQITCSLQKGQRKAVLHDRKAYERINEHIGRFPVVFIAPNDTDLIRDGSEERRRFFDGVLAQANADYLQKLLQYNQLLAQRNGLLKQFAERNYIDDALLELYSNPLLELAKDLFALRQEFMRSYLPIFQKYYQNLGESREQVAIIYESEVGSADFISDFWASRYRDIQSQRTNRGIHKDDFVFEIDQQPLRKFGSQGQQKSFVIALKLAQFELLATQKQKKPLLLLDDIFDKLDDRRIIQLLTMMQNGTFEQVFLTDARPERTRNLLETFQKDVRFFQIQKQ